MTTGHNAERGRIEGERLHSLLRQTVRWRSNSQEFRPQRSARHGRGRGRACHRHPIIPGPPRVEAGRSPFWRGWGSLPVREVREDVRYRNDSGKYDEVRYIRRVSGWWPLAVRTSCWNGLKARHSPAAKNAQRHRTNCRCEVLTG
jgi:hypothetical protein